MFEVVEVFEELDQSARFAFRFPIPDELSKLIDVFAVLRSRALRHFQPLDEIGQDFAGRPALQRLALIRKELQQLRERAVRGVEPQLRLRRLQHVVKRRAALLGGPLREPDQIGGFEAPCWSREYARAGDVVERSHNEPQIGQHIPH